MERVEVSTVGANLLEPTVWRDRLGYESHVLWQTIGRVPLDGSHLEAPQTPVVSTRKDWAGRYSERDGRTAFLSDRSGADELWITGVDGRDPFQLTHLGAGPLSDVAWSPDEKSIAVSSMAGKVYLVSVNNGSKRTAYEGLPITDEIASNLAFARDGKSIYVSSQPGTGEKYELLKVPVAGGVPAKIVDGVITNFAESPDGRWLFYSRASSMNDQKVLGIWRRPVEGGPEERIAPGAFLWDVGPDGLYLVSENGLYSENGTVEKYSFTGKRIGTVAKLGQYNGRAPLSISPDGKSALFVYEERSTIEIDMVQGLK